MLRGSFQPVEPPLVVNMRRGRRGFKQCGVTRAVKGVRKADVEVERVEIHQEVEGNGLHLALSVPRPVPRRGLSRIEAAMYIGISPSKFDELRKDGRVGPARLIDGRKVWDVRDLDSAFEALPMETNEATEDWTAAV